MIFKSRITSSITSVAENRVAKTLFSRLRDHLVPIFMLHRMRDDGLAISGHDPEIVRSSLAYAKKHGYNFLSLDKLIECLISGNSIPPRSIVFTMDDGFYDQLIYGASIFSEFDCPVTIFLLGEFSAGVSWPWDYQIEYIIETTKKRSLVFDVDGVEREFLLDTPLGKKVARDLMRDKYKSTSTDLAVIGAANLAEALDVDLPQLPPERYRPIRWEEARQHEDKIVRFGAHSMRHTILAKQSTEVSRQEVMDSYNSINRELVNPSQVFCYPTGRPGLDFGEREMDVVKAAGFSAALSVQPSYVNSQRPLSEHELFALPRFSLPNNLPDFIQICSWIEAAKEKMRGRN